MGRKKYDRSIESHIRTLNDHIGKMARYPSHDTSAAKTIRNTLRELQDVMEKSGEARRQRKFWDSLKPGKK